MTKTIHEANEMIARGGEEKVFAMKWLSDIAKAFAPSQKAPNDNRKVVNNHFPSRR